MKTLDRYVIREILPPFLIAILVFTFILIIPFIIELAEQMIAKGVPWPMLLRLMVTLLPSALALTIPMSLLIGILVAFGRLSADREVVVMMACGISPYRLLRPLAVLALVSWAASSWVLLKAMPDANQAFRELTMQIVADRAEGEVRPRVFFEDFPNMVLYVREIPQSGGWQDVLAADTSNPAQPVLFLARTGRMLVDRQARTIQMVLEDGARHTTKLDDPNSYEVLRFQQMVVSLNPGERLSPERPGPRRQRADDRGAARPRRRARGAGGLHPQPGDDDPQEVLHSGGVLRLRAARSRARRQQPQGRQARQLRPRHRRDLRLLRDHVHGPGDDQGRHDPRVAGDVAAEHHPRHRRRRAADVPRAFGGSADSDLAAAAAPAALDAVGVPGGQRRRRDRGRGNAQRRQRPRRRRDPHSAVRTPPAQPARRLRRAAVPAHPGHDDRRHAGTVLHLDVHRPVGQVVQGPDDVRADPARSCGGRRRSSCPTSSRWPCCSPRW